MVHTGCRWYVHPAYLWLYYHARRAAAIFYRTFFLLSTGAISKKITWQQAVLLGVIIACLLYSKYHAILLIGFTVLSNFKLSYAMVVLAGSGRSRRALSAAHLVAGAA